MRDASNPWLQRRVLAYAHQGGAWEAPSSTLYAIRRALASGVTGIELDVHATADGHLVVCHDATVDRTTDGSGAIATMTLDELRRLDAAYWSVPGGDARRGLPPEAYPWRGKAPEDHELGIATLSEVLALLADHPGVALNLDIKQTAPAVVAYEAGLAALLGEYGLAGSGLAGSGLAGSGLVGHGRRDDVIVASFDDGALEAFSACAPEVATSAGRQALIAFWQAVQAGPPGSEMASQTVREVALQVPPRFGGVDVVDEQFVAAAHEYGLAVHVWTINETAEMDRLVALGVDGIMTDVPTALVTLLDERGVAYRP